MKNSNTLKKFMAGFLAVPYGDLSDRWEACAANLYGRKADNPYEKNDMPLPFVEDMHIDVNHNYHVMRML